MGGITTNVVAILLSGISAVHALSRIQPSPSLGDKELREVAMKVNARYINADPKAKDWFKFDNDYYHQSAASSTTFRDWVREMQSSATSDPNSKFHQLNQLVDGIMQPQGSTESNVRNILEKAKKINGLFQTSISASASSSDSSSSSESSSSSNLDVFMRPIWVSRLPQRRRSTGTYTGPPLIELVQGDHSGAIPNALTYLTRRDSGNHAQWALEEAIRNLQDSKQFDGKSFVEKVSHVQQKIATIRELLSHSSIHEKHLQAIKANEQSL